VTIYDFQNQETKNANGTESVVIVCTSPLAVENVAVVVRFTGSQGGWPKLTPLFGVPHARFVSAGLFTDPPNSVVCARRTSIPLAGSGTVKLQVQSIASIPPGLPLRNRTSNSRMAMR
jgi:hypothetical protein